METALTNIPPELQAKLDRDRSRSQNQFPVIPQIKLANKDMTQAPEGEYFIETKKKDEPSEIQKLGKNPELTILYKTATYSWYDETQNEMMAWTSDIHGYGDSPVTLYMKKNDKVVIDFDGTFNQFKDYRKKFDVLNPTTGLKQKSLLTFRNVLYVLFEGKPHKMFVSNASAVGVQPDGKPSFDKAQRHSMQYFTDMCWNEQKALYDFAVTMGSKLVRKKKEDGEDYDPNVIFATVTQPFYVLQFQSVRKLEGKELIDAIGASLNAEKAIYAIDAARKNQVQEEQHKVTPEEALEVFSGPDAELLSHEDSFGNRSE